MSTFPQPNPPPPSPPPPAPSNKARRIGPPRLDKYNKLISRLYEVLILLSIEHPIQGPHIIFSHDNASLATSRRRLTKNLSFICDRRKGGQTTTSIAIEDCEDCYKFHWASNMKDDGKTPHRDSEISAFLEHILRRLQQVSRLPTVSSSRLRDEEEAVARDCATFSSKRVKKEGKILSNMVDKSLVNLRETSVNHSSLNETEITGLGPWLQQFLFEASETSYRICLVAYNARNDPQMDTLRRLGQEVGDDPSAERIASAYRTVRHFIGRLADHIRIGKQLLEDAIRMRHVLDVFQVAKVEPPVCVPPPEVDTHTTLDGILTRMFPSKDSNLLSEFQFVLGRQEQHVGIEAKVKDKYTKIHAKPPVVHSEIQVLEHFHRHKLRFADGDRFVGTSKFACFCCKLYFRHHPSRPVEPDSHEQVFLNWGPVALAEGSFDPLFVEQRGILQLVIQDLRATVLQLLGDKHMSAFYHPNSITGVTRSADSYHPPVSEGETSQATQSSDEPESDSDGGAAL